MLQLLELFKKNMDVLKHDIIMYMNLLARSRCPIMHRSSHKACVDVKNDQFKTIKATLILSRRHLHNVMFKVGFHI